MPARSLATSMTMHCRPRQRPRTGILCSRAYLMAPILPSMPRTPKPPGMRIPSTPSSWPAASSGFSQSSLVTQRMVTLASLPKPPASQRLGRRQVRVGQVHVLADQGDGDRAGRAVHPAQQVVPGRPVDVVERKLELADDVGVQALAVQHLRDVVDGRRVRGGDHRLLVHVAHQADLALEAVADRPVASAPRSRRAGCRWTAARPPSAGSAWSSARRSGRCTAAARRG